MTNADKILKDDISIEEVASEFESFCEMLKENYIVLTYKQEMEQFLNCEIEPTLTEDERAILRNMKHVDTIKRIDGHIYVDNSIETENYYREEFSRYMVEFDHLFHFIKERRRIFNKRIIRR